jgi:Ca2+-binding RTX toxin-like protein
VNGIAGTIAEGAANGTAVGLDVSVDPSSLLAGQPVTYSLVDSFGGLFVIDPTTGIVTVGNTSLLDYETAPEVNGGADRGHIITVEASTLGFSSTRTFAILVTPGNDAPEAPVDADADLDHVTEGAATGTLVGITAQATDPNGNPVTYSLADNDGGRFQINATTGVVSVLNGALLDYETTSLHYVTVRATDSLGAFTDSVFAISLDDFTGDQPVDSDAASDVVDENAATGTYTGITASAVSPTASPLTYSLVDNADGRFQINATTGAITVLNGALLDVETQSAWNVTVRATDGVSTGDQVFTIYLNDVAVETWTGTGGNDTFTLASLGEWTLNGLGGNDTLTAIDGANVTFVGGAGNDTLNGRNGNDIFQYAGTTNGLDAVSGGEGYDAIQAMANNTTIGLSAISGIEEINSGGFANVTLQLGTGNDVIDSIVTTLTGITSIRAGAGNDTIIGTYADETILGEDGNDFILGGSGADILNGGNGVDTVSYAGSWDALTINLATNAVSGGDATGDTITGFENVVGSDHNDTITGSTAANVIEGGAGDDAMDGGAGNDTFRIGLSSGIDSIIGGTGTDTVLFTADNAVLAVSSLATVEAFNAAGIINATITGTDLNNTLNFGSATMTNIAGIYGLAGNDTITGSAGADIIVGGDGNDTLNGGNGDDIFRYDDADEGFDAVNGGAGADIIEATGSGVVIGLSSITGIETINGYGDTLILGSTASNTFNFSAMTINGATIDGGGGNDTITGTSAYDYIYGGAGADRLSGYLGSDILRGDAGNDIFDFNTVADSDALNGEDIILDFVQGQDKIDVTTIDANLGLAGDQNFSFQGVSDFTGVAGQLRYQNDLGDGYTHIFADVDGDAISDFHVWLEGTYTMAASDFIL